MPKRSPGTRRFQPRDYCVSQAVVDEEARRIGREVEDAELFAHTDLLAQATTCHANARHDWQHLQKLLEDVPSIRSAAIRRCLFRDLWFVVMAYRQSMQVTGGDSIIAAPTPTLEISVAATVTPTEKFAEWLFGRDED